MNTNLPAKAMPINSKQIHNRSSATKYTMPPVSSLFFCVLSLLVVVSAVKSHQHPEPSDIHWSAQNEIFNMSLYDQTNQLLRSVSRADVMARAKDWVSKKIPYCQCNGAAECCGHCPYCGSYRCDCSGYVSHCWGLPYGYTTFTLPQVSHEISKDDLQEGDVLLYEQEHVVLFGGWADKDKKTYHAYQEPGCHTVGPHHAYESTVPYPFNWEPSMFKPYRYNHIA